MKISYFGTNINESGHFLWEISSNGDSLYNRGFPSRARIPFDPEHLTNNLRNGETAWMTVHGALGQFTVCAIAGSCADSRPGSKSVFWVPCIMHFAELRQRILDTPILNQMINKMPFSVKW